MADKSVHREKVEFKNTVKLEKAVTVTGKGLTQIVFSAETTIPVTADNNTDITVATIPANATIVDLGLVVGSQLATAGSSKCKVSFGTDGGAHNDLVAFVADSGTTTNQINNTGATITAGVAPSVSNAALATSSGVALTFADGAELTSASERTLVCRVRIEDVVLSAPGGLRAFVKYTINT
tara:strand:- start:88 stop:630 length:543 start_codon:yes stop_codon:yes gene_type:complete